MSRFQKICIAWAIIVSLLTLFPPFIYRYENEVIVERIWGFLFDPPVSKRGYGMEIDLKTLFIEFLFVSFCFLGVMIATKKTVKKLQDKSPKELSEKPDSIIEDLKQYALKTKDLLIKEHVLDNLTICVQKANESEEDLLGLIESGAEDFAGNFTYSFLLEFEKHTLRDAFFGILKSDTTKAALMREYDKLITAYEGIFPITKELEEIHEKKIELLNISKTLENHWWRFIEY